VEFATVPSREPPRPCAPAACGAIGTGASWMRAPRLGISPSTLSFHLKELTHAGLVEPTRAGRHLIYRPSIERMNALLAYLSAHCCQGADCGVGATSAAVVCDAPSDTQTP